jgi:hypothetical protein
MRVVERNPDACARQHLYDRRRRVSLYTDSGTFWTTLLTWMLTSTVVRNFCQIASMMYALTRQVAGFGLVLFVLMVGGTARPVFADSTMVSQAIIAGTRSASVTGQASGEVPSRPAAHSAQIHDGTVTLIADDSSGSGAGWNVTLRSSDFVYSGPNGGTNIPAFNFSLTTN